MLSGVLARRTGDPLRKRSLASSAHLLFQFPPLPLEKRGAEEGAPGEAPSWEGALVECLVAALSWNL